jgi:hypothetical protein
MPPSTTGSTRSVAAGPAARPILRRPTAWPWWLQVLAVYGLTRLWSTAVLLAAAAGQPESYWGPAQPDYGTFAGLFWDGSWYRSIAEDGYPATLPVDPDGVVQQSAWAFFPLFPMLVRALMAATGGPWTVVAPTAALLLGAGAALVLDRLVQSQVAKRSGVGADVPGGRRIALVTVLLVGLYPAAPVLQVAYSESLALLLIALTLLLLVQRRYLWAVPAVLAVGFTRAVALPLAVVVVVHLVLRWRDHRANRDALSGAAVARIGALAVAAGTAGVAWPVVVGAVTGVPDAYVQIQAAWRGTFSSAPVVPWFEMAEYLMGRAGLLVLVLAVVAVIGLACSREAGAAGPEVQAWGIAYLAYLLLVAFPQSSMIRFLLLAFPLGVATTMLARTAWRLAAVAGIFAALQVAWVIWLWQLVEPTAWPP